MDNEGLVKISRDNILAGRRSLRTSEKMERLNPWLKHAELLIIKEKEEEDQVVIMVLHFLIYKETYLYPPSSNI